MHAGRQTETDAVDDSPVRFGIGLDDDDTAIADTHSTAGEWMYSTRQGARGQTAGDGRRTGRGDRAGQADSERARSAAPLAAARLSGLSVISVGGPSADDAAEAECLRAHACASNTRSLCALCMSQRHREYLGAAPFFPAAAIPLSHHPLSLLTSSDTCPARILGGIQRRHRHTTTWTGAHRRAAAPRRS